MNARTVIEQPGQNGRAGRPLARLSPATPVVAEFPTRPGDDLSERPSTWLFRPRSSGRGTTSRASSRSSPNSSTGWCRPRSAGRPRRRRARRRGHDQAVARDRGVWDPDPDHRPRRACRPARSDDLRARGGPSAAAPCLRAALRRERLLDGGSVGARGQTIAAAVALAAPRLRRPGDGTRARRSASARRCARWTRRCATRARGIDSEGRRDAGDGSARAGEWLNERMRGAPTNDRRRAAAPCA